MRDEAVEMNVSERRRPGRAGAASGRAGVWVAALLAAGLGLAAATPAAGSPGVQQDDPTPHSEARLVSEVAAVRPGQPFTVGLQITLEPGWHTYWKNAGDAGNGAIVAWHLPSGFSADSLRYPVPERIPYPPLMNYGYADQVVLLTRITPPAEPGARSVHLSATADFLVCADVCIPASTEVSLDLPVASGPAEPSSDAALIAESRSRLPAEEAGWTLRAARVDGGFVLAARPPAGWAGDLARAYFFPADPTTLSHVAPQPLGQADGELRLRLTQSEYLAGEPDVLEGVLAFPASTAVDSAGHHGLAVAVPVEHGQLAWAADDVTPLEAASVGPAGSDAVSGAAAPTGSVGPENTAGAGSLSLLVALVFAFLGGIILNLMPCVFPILSLKALAFASRGGDREGMRRDGLAFGAGVIVMFLLVAGVLMVVRAGGAQVGWGYQLQSPTVVALLAALMFGIGLWLAGVVELGASLTRLGGIGGDEGPGGSFLTGVLATLVATPCTAPFMGAAVGAALLRPAPEALGIFAALGAGMAAPFVALSFWPALAARLPRPGRWMETFKQFLAFPMFAVAIWLVWVFGLQVGIGGAARLLFGLLLLAVAAWLVGRWPATAIPRRSRILTRGLALLALATAVMAAARGVRHVEPVLSDGATEASWAPFSPEAISAGRAAGRPVFVDFTAAWCISCQVNERVALGTEPVRRAFAAANVSLIRADWTRRDPEITRALAEFGRVGVPLYVLYPADGSAEPIVLPQLLTPGIVLDALGRVTDR